MVGSADWRPRVAVLLGGFEGIGVAEQAFAMYTSPDAAPAWGTVHLALMSTGEDRAKAMVDWTWAGFTHERPGRIVVTPDIVDDTSSREGR